MIIARIRGIPVLEGPGTVSWVSRAEVDADGANGQFGKPFAYRYPTNDGLDNLSDAGWPGGSWRNVLLDSGEGTPLTDCNGNAYSQTEYSWSGKPLHSRYLDAASIPYVVVNPIVRKHAAGVVVGAKATVTYKDKTIEAVVGDVSGANDIGEISIYAAQLLGIPDSPRTGGVDSGVVFNLFPGTPAVIDGLTYNLIPMPT